MTLELPLTHIDPVCSCPSLLSQAVSEGVTFSDLNPAKKYTASVSSGVQGALVALKPPATSHRTDGASSPQATTIARLSKGASLKNDQDKIG